MRRLHILWQRLVDDTGRTCDRCWNTQLQLHGAVEKLKLALVPLGIEPTLEEKTLECACAGDISQSNRIWIAGKPLEDWIGARVGQSNCPCDVCRNAECRTVEVGGAVFEAIPEDLIVRAALLAAADLIGPKTEEPCCDEEIKSESDTDSCCPSQGQKAGRP